MFTENKADAVSFEDQGKSVPFTTEAGKGEKADLLALSNIHNEVLAGQDKQISDLKSLSDQYRELVGTTQEITLKHQEATKRMEDRRNLRNQTLESEVVAQSDLAKAMLEFELFDAQEEEETAYIETAIEGIREATELSPELGALAVSSVKQEHAGKDSVFAMAEDYNKKMAMVKQEIEKARYAYEASSTANAFFDFLGGVIPANWTTSFLDNTATDASYFNPANNLNAQGTKLFSLDMDEFKKELPRIVDKIKEGSAIIGRNEHVEIEALEKLIEDNTGILQDPVFNMQNILSAIDVTGVPSLVSGVSRVVANAGVHGYVAIAGNRAARKALASEEAAISNAAQVAEDILPSVAKSGNAGTIRDNLSGEVQEVLHRNQKLRELASRTQSDRLGFLDEEELSAAIEKTRESNWDGRLVDIRNPSSQGVADIDIGKKDGTVFTRKEWAESLIKENGLQDATVVSALDDYGMNGFVVRLNKSKLDTAGVIKPVDPSKVGKMSSIKRFVLSPDLFTPEKWVNSIQNSQFIHQAIAAQAVRPLIKTVEKLPKAARETVNTLFEYGQRKQLDHYLNLDEIEMVLKRKPTDDELLGYYTMRDLADVSYDLSNTALRNEMSQMGYKALNSGNWQGFAKEISLAEVGDDIIYDLTTKKVVNTPVKDATFVQLQEPIKVGSSYVKYVQIEKASKLQLQSLPQQVLKYNPGFLSYEGKWFTKQTRVIKLESGEDAILNPLTHNVNLTKEEATAFASKWNNILKGYRSYKAGEFGSVEDPAVKQFANDVLAQVTKGDDITVDVVEKKIAKGEITDRDFEVVFDRDLPESMGTFKGRDWSDASSPIAAWYTTTGRSIYSKRGRHLTDAEGKFAATIDVFDEVGKRLNMAMRNGTLNTYRIRAIESWFRAAKGTLVEKNLTPMSAFMHGTFDKTVKGATATKINQLETLRDVIRRNIEIRTQEGVILDRAKESLQHWVDESFLPVKGKKAANWLLEKDPVKIMRGIAFDTKLGFFDPSQMLIQTQTMFSALALSPKFGAQAMFDGPKLRIAMMNNSKDLKGYMGKWKLSDTDKEEFLEMAEVLKGSGIMDVGGEVAFLQNYGETVASNFGRFGKEARSASRFFFYEAERWNRLVGYGIAWRELKATKPGMNMKSAQASEELANLTNKYSMRMTQGSSSWWQKGGLSLATQFYAYPARLLETMFLDKSLTALQKTRLVTAQLLMYGTAGLPMADAALDALYGEEGSKEVRHALETGLWDTILFSPVVGMDTNFADRAGVGGAVATIVRDFMEKPAHELALGASGAIAGDIASSIYNSARYMNIESGSSFGEISPIALDNVLENVSSYKRISKALVAFNQGKYTDSRGNILLDVPKTASIALSLGISFKEVEDMWNMTTKIRAQADLEKDMFKDLKKLRAKAMLSESRADMELFLGMVSAYNKSLDSPMAARRLNKKINSDKAWMDSLTKDVEKKYRKMFGKAYRTTEGDE